MYLILWGTYCISNICFPFLTNLSHKDLSCFICYFVHFFFIHKRLIRVPVSYYIQHIFVIAMVIADIHEKKMEKKNVWSELIWSKYQICFLFVCKLIGCSIIAVILFCPLMVETNYEETGVGFYMLLQNDPIFTNKSHKQPLLDPRLACAKWYWDHIKGMLRRL